MSSLAADASSMTTLTALPVQNAAKETAEGILYGSIAGIVGKYIEYPFDTVKVRLQSQPAHLPLRYTGPLDCFRQSLRADGLLGLYRGISAPLFGAAAETSSLFIFESLGREALCAAGLAPRDASPSLPALYATGAFAGALTSFVLTPIELVKCRIQVPESSSPTSPARLKPLAVIRDVFRHDGLRGFWHGQTGTLIRESGGSAAWFGAKETVTLLFYNRAVAVAQGTDEEEERIRAAPLPLWQQAVAGASAGVSYNFLFFPADTVKSRMQTAALGGTVKPSFWSEGATLWQQSGLRGLYRGCGITCLRSAPSSAFIFMVFDGLKRYFPL